jgi:predicted DNA-binding transcriptional regulator AlpA
MIRERVMAGLERAKAQGVTLGRPNQGGPEGGERHPYAPGPRGRHPEVAKGLGAGVSTVQRMSAPDRRAKLDRDHPQVSMRRQCAILGIARSGVYRLARPAPSATRLRPPRQATPVSAAIAPRLPSWPSANEAHRHFRPQALAEDAAGAYSPLSDHSENRSPANLVLGSGSC